MLVPIQGVQVLDNIGFLRDEPFQLCSGLPRHEPCVSGRERVGRVCSGAGRRHGRGSTFYVAGQVSTSASSLSMLGPGGANVLLNVNSGGTTLAMSALPSSNPGAGGKQLWYDPADNNRVKYAN